MTTETLVNALQIFARRRPEILLTPKSFGLQSLLFRAWELLTFSGTSASESTPSRSLIETKYGLRIVQAAGSGLHSAHLITSKNAVNNTRNNESLSEFHYRVFPDWQTSFFWNDPDYFRNSEDDPTVNDKDIGNRYPTLAPFFFAWRNMYEAEFEKQEIHLGVDAEVFSNPEVRVAWCVEGFLMASWLALQNNVKSVQYMPDTKAYVLKEGNIDEQLQLMITDMNALLKS